MQRREGRPEGRRNEESLLTARHAEVNPLAGSGDGEEHWIAPLGLHHGK